MRKDGLLLAREHQRGAVIGGKFQGTQGHRGKEGKSGGRPAGLAGKRRSSAVAATAAIHCGRFGEVSGRDWESMSMPAPAFFRRLIPQLGEIGNRCRHAGCTMAPLNAMFTKIAETAVKNKRSSLFLQHQKKAQLFLPKCRLFQSQKVFCSSERKKKTHRADFDARLPHRP
jgi:hypothetical protein